MLKPPQTGSHRRAVTTADRLLDLIHAYQQAAGKAVRALKAAYSIPNCLEAWHANRIAEAGVLTAESISGHYAFHGTGCRFEFNESTIDVEFGPSGRCDGFDAWRLGQFAAAQQPGNDWIGNLPGIEQGLADLEQTGLIVRPGWEPNPHLYYLASDV